MRNQDIVSHAFKAIFIHRLRTALILLGVAIGVSAVILLTALGDSARRYVVEEFMALGTNIITVLPGRSETVGGAPPMMGETPRDLTTDDAQALLRSHNVLRVAPVILGSAPVSWQGLEREVTIIGTTSAMESIRQLQIGQGQFLPNTDPYHATPVCVIGNDVKTELFGSGSALGQWLRIADRRFRVVGVLAGSGVSIGMDLDDMVFIPVTSAQNLFDRPSLFRILTEAKSAAQIDAASNDIKRIIKARHEGEDDITIVTQDSIIATFNKIFTALTIGLAGIAGISLGVAGILIMNIMLVSVSQRTREVGLLKALGASSMQVRSLFMTEACMLSIFGGVIGLSLAIVVMEIIQYSYPQVPVTAPVWAIVAALFTATITGLLFGVLPAIRASRLDPVKALSGR